jgi:O-antigen ligase
MYIVGTWGVLYLCALFWASDYRIARKVLVFSGIVLFVWLLVILARHGMAFGRLTNSAVGGVNRNAYGSVATSALACVLFSNKRWLRWIAIVLTYALLMLVASRGGILTTSFFLAVYYVLQRGLSRAAVVGAMGVVLCGVVLMVSAPLQDFIFETIFRLHDPSRGIGSGFTGRAASWMESLDFIRKRPVLGYGFRARTSGITLPNSNGYFNLLLETGVVGASLVVSAMLVATFQRIRAALRLLPLVQQSEANRELFFDALQLNSIAGAVLFTMLFYWFVEPFYINLGNTMTVVHFLMLTAPMYAGLTRRDLENQLRPTSRSAVRR